MGSVTWGRSSSLVLSKKFVLGGHCFFHFCLFLNVAISIEEGSPHRHSSPRLKPIVSVQLRVRIRDLFLLLRATLCSRFFLLLTVVDTVDGAQKTATWRCCHRNRLVLIVGLRLGRLFLFFHLLIFVLISCKQKLLILLLLVIAAVLNVLLVLEVELSALEVDVVDVEVVVVKLHVNLLLPFLVHLVFFETLVNLVDLVRHLRFVLGLAQLLNFCLRCVHDVVRLHLVRLLIAEVQVDQGSADLDGPALPRVDLESLLHHHQSAEFAQVVEQQEFIVQEFDLGVVAGD